jgi:hypothetical protein
MRHIRTLPCGILCLVLAAQAASNPVPLIDHPLSPTRITPGSGSFTLTVNGTGFIPASVLRWNGLPLPTSFVSAARLTAKVSRSALGTPSSAQVTVFNPAPGGGSSNVVPFAISAASPTIFLNEFNYIPTPALTYSVVTGDFNGDGKLDIAAAMGTSIGIFLGNGDGTFSVSSFTTTAEFVGPLVAADFNGDGKVDLAFPDPHHNLVHTLLGNGDGTFSEVSTTLTGAHPAGMVAADFNGDGKLDLVIANQGGGSISVLLGKGDGTFLHKPNFKIGSKPNAVTVADFNGDGHLDLAVVNSGSNTVSILLGSGDGTFNLKSSLATGSSPFGIVASDFNNDGNVDLAVTNKCGDSADCNAPGFASVTELLGDGDGTFSSSTVVIADYHYPQGIAAGDFNADGKIDLVITGDGESNGVVLLGNGKGQFSLAASPGHRSSGEWVVIGDFDGDGRLDYALNNDFAIQGGLWLEIELQLPVAFYPAVLVFPSQTVGTTSPPKTMRFANVGPRTLSISNTQVGGNFAGTSNCPATLDSGASCTFTITFTPTFKGLTGGGASVSDDAYANPQDGYLEGRGK